MRRKRRRKIRRKSGGYCRMLGLDMRNNTTRKKIGKHEHAP